MILYGNKAGQSDSMGRTVWAGQYGLDSMGWTVWAGQYGLESTTPVFFLSL